VTLHTFERDQVGRKRHVEYPTPKHVENSLHGSKWAKSHGYKTNDLDMLCDKVLTQAARRARLTKTKIPRSAITGHIPNAHWPDPFKRDGFRDPKRKVGKGDHFDEMVPEEWRRIVAGHRWTRLYHVPPIEAQLRLCADIKLQALLEPKHSPVWLHQEVWDYLAVVAEREGTHVAVYSLMHECLPFARRAGFNAWAI
jgi:hypothetical protein